MVLSFIYRLCCIRNWKMVSLGFGSLFSFFFFACNYQQLLCWLKNIALIHVNLLRTFLQFCNRSLTIGQMQGKFQMVVVRHSGHAIQVYFSYFSVFPCTLSLCFSEKDDEKGFTLQHIEKLSPILGVVVHMSRHAWGCSGQQKIFCPLSTFADQSFIVFFSFNNIWLKIFVNFDQLV